MTTGTLTGSTGICRCAVCKIDLRGRFVVVDAQTEKLLGYACVELFGKSILDYLDTSSKALIEQVLSDRNHYETHYDHALLTLLGKSGNAIEVDATISLCFAAGNPVNYLLILNQRSQSVQPSDEVDESFTTEDFIQRCLALEPGDCLSWLPDLLCQYTQAEQAAIYLIVEDRLEAIAGAQAGSSEPFSFETITEPTELHHRVAQTNEVYALGDESAAHAGDADIEALPEFVASATLDNRSCLLRFVFSAQMPSDMQPQATARARLALQVAEKLFSAAPASSDDTDPGIDMKFTIGFLSTLGFGALLTDADGTIVGYNPILVEMLDQLSPGETSRDFVDLLEGDDSSGWAALIHEQLRDSDTADLRIDLTLGSGAQYLLVIIRFGDQPGDQTACWVLIPRSQAPDNDSETHHETSVWSSLVDGLKPALDDLAGGAEQVSRDYCRQVKHLDDSGLNRLHEAVRTMHQILADSSLLYARRQPSSSVAVSLGDLVDEATETVRGEFPDVTINCMHAGLPSIKTSRVRLAAVLRNLMTNCVRHNPKNEVTLSVDVSMIGDHCRIAVTDEAAGMPRRQFQRLFDIYLPPKATGIPRRSGGAGLGLSRLLVHDLGGKIRGASKEGVGTRFAVMLPQTIRSGS